MSDLFKDPRFIVYPGLALSGKELRMRMENRTIKIRDTGKVYISDPDLVRTGRLAPDELAREHVNGIKKQVSLQEKADKLAAKIAKEQIVKPTKGEGNE